ncbi:hypothetical protein BJX70DRAFT_385515 [Aspergillus crustosus]
MPQKKRNFNGSGSGSSPYSKRQRPLYTEDDQDDEDTQNSVTPYEKPRNHPVFGQKSAFPGLDTSDGDELFYGPAEDGLEYLRMVRSEANSLPTLFNASATTELSTETSDVIAETKNDQDHTQQVERPDEKPSTSKLISDGVFSDGVYIGRATTKPAAVDTFSDAQATYYNLLHHRFLLLRSILKCTPPPEAISALDDSHPISFPRRSKTAQKEWRRLLLMVDPQTVQLACMDLESVLSVLMIVGRLMSENVRSRDPVLVRRIGAWAWGLLGKCRDSGQCGAQEIGDIRELGKRAVKILGKMRAEQKEVQEEDEEEEYGSEADNGQDDVQIGDKGDDLAETSAIAAIEQPDPEKGTDAQELELAKARLGARISAVEDESIPQEEGELEAQDEEESLDLDFGTQTRAMLDMIITIIGEHYGQRDLLEARDVWTNAEQTHESFQYLLSESDFDLLQQTHQHPHRPPPTTTRPRLKMAPSLEISIPTTTTSTTSPPYTIYNMTLRLPLRSFAISKRYTDFTTFHNTLTTQTTTPPPLPLPPKSWLKNTVSNTDLRESRRQGLESYLRAINESDDPRWRNSPAWRAFLNLPSLGNTNKENGNGNASGFSATSARLHAAATGPGLLAGTEPITDPTLWLDCYRDMKSHLHDARLHLTRRDQETTPQRQHESSARAKSALVRAGTLITALDEGLAKRLSENSSSNGRHSSPAPSLGDGEVRRRKDLLINARKEKDGLEDLLNAMAAKSRVDNAVASIKDKEALVGAAAAAGGGGGRKFAKSGRVLGKETERTRELDNQGVVQLQRDMIQEQDLDVQSLMKIVRRQKELGIQINEELEIQNEMLRMVDEDTTRVEQKVEIGKKRLGKIS